MTGAFLLSEPTARLRTGYYVGNAVCVRLVMAVLNARVLML